MRLFLIGFFVIYSSFHLYAFMKARSALALGLGAGAALALFMAVMVGAPVIVRLAEAAGHEFLARTAAVVGYTWLGLLFLFVSISAVTDAWRLVLKGTSACLGLELSALQISPAFAFGLAAVSSLGICVYGHFEAANIRLETVVIHTPKIPQEIGSVRVVQISDVHLGLLVREQRLARILDRVRAARPDLLVSTGDLVDGQINRLDGLAAMFQAVTPKYGKFAVTGNHEFYAGLPQALEFTREAGFTVLRGESRTAGDIIIVAGVDDETGESFGLSPCVPEQELLASLPPGRFVLFLKHRPLVHPDSAGLFDLQLSGHTHGGQIFPFGIVTWLYYPVHAGVMNPRDHSYLYVSRGSGTWGPMIRFLSPPEVTVFELIHAPGTDQGKAGG